MKSEDERFVEEHTALVRKLAARVRSELDLTCDLEDLVAFGFHGLLEAKGRFDPTRGVQFSTFAHYRVRGAVLDGVRKMAYLPRRAHQARKAAEALDAMSEEELAARAANPEARTDLAATLGAVDEILGRMTASFVIAAVGQDESAPRTSPEDELIAADQAHRVRDALALLPEREAFVVRGFYLESRPLDDIAADLGVSKSWASRIHTRALGMMRESLEAAGMTSAEE